MEENTVNPPATGLDEIDRAVIAAMQKDGRASFAQIAEQMGVSAGMIRLRYNRLAEQGYLRVVGKCGET